MAHPSMIPVYLYEGNGPEYPKMLYKGQKVADQKALEQALASGKIRTQVVNSRSEEEKSEYTADLSTLIGVEEVPEPAAPRRTRARASEETATAE